MEKTKLVILGVDHSLQLFSRKSHPGHMKAYFDTINPDVICIERDPESYANHDYYEFTYEIQEIAVPYALYKRIPLSAIDWVPPASDQERVWGVKDILLPNVIRDNFLSFSQESITKDLFFAEFKEIEDKIDTWMNQDRLKGEHDFPRRLSLYRTFMQAMNIKKVCQIHHGKTILVIIGYMHKYDIESILANETSIDIQKSSDYQYSLQAAEKFLSYKDLLAIASFNLLGVQSEKVINGEWLSSILTNFVHDNSPEVQLLNIRYDKLCKQLTSRNAFERYRTLLVSTSPNHTFTYSGVKDMSRVDSFYDPFGNLSVRNRILLEMARECEQLNQSEKANNYKSEIIDTLSVKQQEQINTYYDMFIKNQ